MTDAVPVRDAATVVLLRDGPAGVESWLLRRVADMVFASGMTVFPGGRVDPGDGELPWSGRPASVFAAEFGCEEQLARALVGAAVRETFEETGVLLCAPPAQHPDRQSDVESGRLGFGALLSELGLAIDADALRPWGRWVTPVGESRRYDARFFVGALPAGAGAADLTTESSVAEWMRPADALAENREHRRPMLPPTKAVLRDIAAFATVADVLAASARRDLAPVQPILRRDTGGAHVELPDGRTFRMDGPV